jgi:integrase
LRVEDIQQREEHWVIADLVGKGGHIQTIPVPDWVKAGIEAWTVAAGVTTGALPRSINKASRVWGTGFSPKVIWGVVKQKAKACEIPALAAHDLRRTRARLCHQAGGELEQMQFLLGHVSVQTTERYLDCNQRARNAVADRIGLEPDAVGSPQIPPRWPTSGDGFAEQATSERSEMTCVFSSTKRQAVLHCKLKERTVCVT